MCYNIDTALPGMVEEGWAMATVEEEYAAFGIANESQRSVVVL